MATFKTIDCEPKEINFFANPDYERHSFSTQWSTATTPDVEGLTTPVWLQVLDHYNIPVSTPDGLPPGGTLPGIDIKNMDARRAIKLSLAEALIYGEWWELYEDGEGGVIVEKVFDTGAPGKTIDLDIRMCIPSANKTNQVDMVIVHGYKRPPQRYAREFKEVVPAGVGEINPSLEDAVEDKDLFTIDPSQLFPELPCHTGALSNTVAKSYPDPVITNEFNPQEPNPFYDVKKGEKVLGYVHRVKGMPESPDEAARVNYSFSDKTTVYHKITLPNFTEASVGNICDDLPSDNTIKFFKGTFTITTPDFLDRYGTKWPFVVKPSRIVFSGYQVENIIDLSAFNAVAGDDGVDSIVFLNPVSELKRLSEGSQFIFNVKNANEYEVTIYYQPKFASEFWSYILQLTENTQVRFSDGLAFDENKIGGYAKAASLSGDLDIIGGSGGLGYSVGSMYIALECRRPSVTVNDSLGQALSWAERLSIEYAPLILKEEDPPTAYWHKDEGGKIVDKTQTLVDADPSTCQNFEETDEQKMQDLTTGNTIEVSLPFCKDGEECLEVAKTIFDYMTYEDVTTYNLTCGPDDEPELGAAVNGFPIDLRVNNISYNFQDGSSYTVDVGLGPVFENIGSWNNTNWLKRTEDVTRPAIVIWTAGDGVNYRVRVQGLGEYNAINGSSNAIWYVGEVVEVTIHNNPVEE